MDRYLCVIEGCPAERWSRGWCSRHYARWRRHGSPDGDHRPKMEGEALMSQVVTSGEHWLWSGPEQDGYGIFNWASSKRYAHRAIYELLVAPVPPGLELDHLCEVKLCTRPSHLEPVTHRVNILRGQSPAARNARKTHCLKGHEFTPENTYSRPEGGRRCRTCKAERDRNARSDG